MPRMLEAFSPRLLLAWDPNQPRNPDGTFGDGEVIDLQEADFVEPDAEQLANDYLDKLQNDVLRGIDEKQLQELASKILPGAKGRSEILSKLHSLSGMPADCKLTRVAQRPGGGLSVEFRGGDVEFAVRELFAKGKERVVKNTVFILKSEAQGKGSGSKIFADQVASLSAEGFSRIEADLSRSEYEDDQGNTAQMNGYYTWPRLGYDAKVPARIQAKLRKELGPKAKVATVQELMKNAKGRDAWKKLGVSVAGSFDLSTKSTAQKVLTKYLKEKDKKGQKPKPAGRKSRRIAASLPAGYDLGRNGPDGLDEQLLDRIWDEIAAEDPDEGDELVAGTRRLLPIVQPRYLLAWDPDQERDENGRFASGAGGGSAGKTDDKSGGAGRVASVVRSLWSKVATTIGIAKPPKPAATPAERPVELETRDARSAAAGKSLAEAAGHLALLDLTSDPLKTDLQRSPELRSSAVNDPEAFDQNIESAEVALRQSLHFGADAIIATKLEEISRLKQDVAAFRARHQPEALSVDLQELPGYFGRKGAGKINTAMAASHLAKGKSPKETVSHLMKTSGLAESTAKRYVRAAVKAAAAEADRRAADLERRLRIYPAVRGAFNPDQPRNPDGTFGSGGGDGSEPTTGDPAIDKHYATLKAADRWATKNVVTGPPPMSGQEAAASDWYRRSGDEIMNGTERGQRSGIIRRILDKITGTAAKVQDGVKQLDGLIARSEIKEPTTVHRGMKVLGNPADVFKAGSEVSDPGFMSTSLVPAVAERFAVSINPEVSPVLFQIDLPKGANGYYMPRVAGKFDEAEILMPRNARFKIESVTQEKQGLKTLTRVKMSLQR